jgi:hypothetical protein
MTDSIPGHYVKVANRQAILYKVQSLDKGYLLNQLPQVAVIKRASFTSTL